MAHTMWRAGRPTTALASLLALLWIDTGTPQAESFSAATESGPTRTRTLRPPTRTPTPTRTRSATRARTPTRARTATRTRTATRLRTPTATASRPTATATRGAAEPTSTRVDARTATSTRAVALATPTGTPTEPAGTPNDGGGFSEFLALCPFSHRLADDVIVFPGMPGHAHVHSFFGNVATDSDTTLDELLAGDTTCDPVEDRSAYWVPTLWHHGEPIEPEQATFYYFNDHKLRTAVQPFPLGLRIIAGDGSRSGPTDGPSRYKWSCRGADASSTGDFAVCPAGHELELLLNFPDCWNGVDIDSPDHKSHMAYAAGGTCPASHPVPLPKLQFKLRYPISGDEHLSISAGAGEHAHVEGRGWTIHGDFFNAWEPDAQRFRVDNCLRRSVKCETNGRP